MDWRSKDNGSATPDPMFKPYECKGANIINTCKHKYRLVYYVSENFLQRQNAASSGKMKENMESLCISDGT